MVMRMNRATLQLTRHPVDSPAIRSLPDGTVANSDLLLYLRQLERLAFRDLAEWLENRAVRFSAGATER